VLSEWLVLVGLTIGALLPIVNPFSTAPVFVSLTQGMSEERRNQQARRATIYMACVLLGAFAAGSLVLEFFGISMPALRIAGGLVVARIGFNMLNPSPEDELRKDEQAEAQRMDDIAFVPIAMPLLSGPGSIAVTISMATSVDNFLEHIPIAIGIVTVAILSWMVLRSSGKVVNVLGKTGVNVMTRLMGLILICIGIQFVANGFIELITDQKIVTLILEAYPR